MPDPNLTYDSIGNKAENHITAENHDLSVTSSRLIVPQYGLFYIDSLTVQTNTGTLRDYKDENPEWIPLEIDPDVSAAVGQDVAAGIQIMNDSLAGTFTVDYQAVGGEEGENSYLLGNLRNTLQKLLDEGIPFSKVANPQEKIIPAEHPHHLDEMTNLQDVSGALGKLEKALSYMRAPIGTGTDLTRRLDRLANIIQSLRSDMNFVSTDIKQANDNRDTLDNLAEELSEILGDYAIGLDHNSEVPDSAEVEPDKRVPLTHVIGSIYTSMTTGALRDWGLRLGTDNKPNILKVLDVLSHLVGYDLRDASASTLNDTNGPLLGGSPGLWDVVGDWTSIDEGGDKLPIYSWLLSLLAQVSDNDNDIQAIIGAGGSLSLKADKSSTPTLNAHNGIATLIGKVIYGEDPDIVNLGTLADLLTQHNDLSTLHNNLQGDFDTLVNGNDKERFGLDRMREIIAGIDVIADGGVETQYSLLNLRNSIDAAFGSIGTINTNVGVMGGRVTALEKPPVDYYMPVSTSTPYPTTRVTNTAFTCLFPIGDGDAQDYVFKSIQSRGDDIEELNDGLLCWRIRARLITTDGTYLSYSTDVKAIYFNNPTAAHFSLGIHIHSDSSMLDSLIANPGTATFFLEPYTRSTWRVYGLEYTSSNEPGSGFFNIVTATTTAILRLRYTDATDLFDNVVAGDFLFADQSYGRTVRFKVLSKVISNNVVTITMNKSDYEKMGGAWGANDITISDGISFINPNLEY